MDPVDSDSLSRVESYSGAGYMTFLCRLRDYHPLWSIFPDGSARVLALTPVLQPRRDESHRFRLFPFRSPLLRKSLFLSFPGDNEMFQFPPFATYAYGFSARPFGNPGINTRLTASPGLS